MSRMVALLVCLLLCSLPALAQTTWNPADKGSSISLSNGNLTATNTGTGFKTVRATVGKFSGKRCFQFTVNNATGQESIGWANTDWPVESTIGLGRSDFVTPDLSIHSVGALGSAAFGGGLIQWFNNGGTPTLISDGGGAITLVAGKTGEACVDLDTSPPHVWMTADVSGTNGAGGGPLWNGVATSNPATGTVPMLAWLPKYVWYPAFDGNAGDRATAKFGGFTPPPGFNTWDAAGGEPPKPGPTHPNVVNVANAPEWQASHAYALKDRVLNGPAWNGAYTNGQNLCLWAVKVAGTSGSNIRAFDTACNSGTPANVGGGLDGTIPSGWASAATVTDGTVTWALLTKVDYPTLTAATVDDPVNWTPNTAYSHAQTVIYQGKSYLQQRPRQETSPADVGVCTSGAVSLLTIPDGTCSGWLFMGNIPYVSNVPKWPHLICSKAQWGWCMDGQYFDNKIKVWYGGAQRKRYGAGENGESLPIPLTNHRWPAISAIEANTYCYKTMTNPPTDGLGPFGHGNFKLIYGCNGSDGLFHADISPASGDSFADNPANPLRYDETHGVALYTDGTDLETVGGWYPHDVPLGASDNNAVLHGLQFKSLQGTGTATSSGTTLYNNIIESGGVLGILGCCQGGFHDNVIIMSGNIPGQMAISTKYGGPVYNNTAISTPGVANSTFLGQIDPDGIAGWGPASPPPTSNNLFFGFQVPAATAHGQGHSNPKPWNNIGNASDIANSFPMSAPFATSPRAGIGDPLMYPQDFAGLGNTCGQGNSSACVGLSAADVFINPTIGPDLDLRLKAGSPAIGAGAAFAVPYGYCCFTAKPATTDIFGTPRPQGTRYDAGAFQFK
jgi:hypothetical protein